MSIAQQIHWVGASQATAPTFLQPEQNASALAASQCSLRFEATEEARTCEAWFQVTFRPQKWNLKAHMWHQLSPFPSSNAAIAMQHHPGNIHQSVATPATPLHLPTSFPKQILTPSRFKLILLINNGIDWKDHNSCSFWAENFGRSLEGQGGPTRGSKVFNTVF